MGKTTIATIHSTGSIGTAWKGHHVYVEVDTVDGIAAGFIDCNGEIQVDAAGLRRLAAACMDGADHLDKARDAALVEDDRRRAVEAELNAHLRG